MIHSRESLVHVPFCNVIEISFVVLSFEATSDETLYGFMR